MKELNSYSSGGSRGPLEPPEERKGASEAKWIAVKVIGGGGLMTYPPPIRGERINRSVWPMVASVILGT